MAECVVLFEGYVREGGSRIAGTVSLVRDHELIGVVDPGMVPHRDAILNALREQGVTPDQVTDVILSHHHPDHTLNVALFPQARVHDHWAVYQADKWTSRRGEGFELSPGIRLIETSGHTRQDITTLVETSEGVAACTHLWRDASGPAEDRLAEDPEGLHRNRARVLGLADYIVPGHGAMFRPGPETPQ